MNKIILGIVVLFTLIGVFFLGSKLNITGKSITVDSNVQEINMNVDYSGYSPNYFTLKVGIPVKWNINVKALTGCNSRIVLKEYNINQGLKEGKNTILFTPSKEGTFAFTCGMGMLKGSFIVTSDGKATQEQINSASSKSSSGSCGCGGAR